MDSKSYRYSHLNKGDDYHVTFLKDDYRSALWELEKMVLDRIITELPFNTNKSSILDFACGTGRILSYLEDRFFNSDGIDVSDSMISSCRKNVNNSAIFIGDITLKAKLVKGPYEVITAFRFFPNAEPTLRQDAMKSLAERLVKGGVLIFNNHQNRNPSWKSIIKTLVKKATTKDKLTDKEIKKLVENNGIMIERRIPLGFIPNIKNRIPLPRKIWYNLETKLSYYDKFFPLAQNVIYVCKKT